MGHPVPARFDQLPDPAVPDDFDESLPQNEAAAPDAAPQDESRALDDWPIDELDDWTFDDPSIDVAALCKSLLESEADLAAGRSLSEEEIHARYGLPRSNTG